MEVKTLQEQSLIKSVWADCENPLLIRLLGRTIDFNKLSLYTLVLLFHLVDLNNDILFSKFKNTDKFKCEKCDNLIGVCLQECPFERCYLCKEKIQDCSCGEYSDDSDDD